MQISLFEFVIVMFKKNKTDYKAKLEHKLHLARTTPEPIFDLSDCGLTKIPSGIYSLCRVFLKESLLLNNNKLTSLSHGGILNDLRGLQILNLSFNSFTSLPEEINVLVCLRELYVNNNNLKSLPNALGSLRNLKILDVSNNCLRKLPSYFGDLSSLSKLIINQNPHLDHLPSSICRAKRLHTIILDADNFLYPPKDVVEKGTESIMRYICQDIGIEYEYIDSSSPESSNESVTDVTDDSQNNVLQEKIWDFEKKKQQKLLDILNFEREYDLYQRQEIELQTALKANKQKILTDITEQQSKLETELLKIQQKKEEEKLKLIKELQEEEEKADVAITNLLKLMREPLSQLLEQEKQEEERLLAAAVKHSCKLRRDDVLEAMKILLQEETNRFKLYDQNREETARSILSQELLSDGRLLDTLRTQGEQQAMLVSQLQKDMELQRIAVGALLERGDARSWSLVQQVHLVESQLAKLTIIEMDRKKLQMDDHLNELAEKRANLSALLIDLLEQQGLRRAQLLSTLQNMENLGQSQEDFWLVQYQQLLERRRTNFTDIQKNIDPEFAQELLLAGVIQYLPFLAKWAQTATKDSILTDDHLIEAGIKNSDDRKQILYAFTQYYKLREEVDKTPIPFIDPNSAGTSAEQPSAPDIHQRVSINATECVICMDDECAVIFVPCGHLCCCFNCSESVNECPLCRSIIERKIRVITP